jgi:hypothetical protein
MEETNERFLKLVEEVKDAEVKMDTSTRDVIDICCKPFNDAVSIINEKEI